MDSRPVSAMDVQRPPSARPMSAIIRAQSDSRPPSAMRRPQMPQMDFRMMRPGSAMKRQAMQFASAHVLLGHSASAPKLSRPGSAPAFRQEGRARKAKPGVAVKQKPPAGSRIDPSESVQQTMFVVPFDVAYKEVAMAKNLRKLENLFLESDRDGSGEINLDEFRKALRTPGTLGTFANLGIQAHQCELVFTFLDEDKSGQLSIAEFLTGLTALVGTNVDGTGKELDVQMLTNAHNAKLKMKEMGLGQTIVKSGLMKSESMPQLPPSPSFTPISLSKSQKDKTKVQFGRGARASQVVFGGQQ
mmetsp:Transcript_10879/g.19362  ORF Transcript_10879/g.19362 Transcript_10879/m.19362 type:complete len:302 (-) Transcript_10879:54-959(-)